MVAYHPNGTKPVGGHCPEYIAERAEYDRRKAIEDQKNAIRNGIYLQKVDGIIRAAKKHGRNKK